MSLVDPAVSGSLSQIVELSFRSPLSPNSAGVCGWIWQPRSYLDFLQAQSGLAPQRLALGLGQALRVEPMPIMQSKQILQWSAHLLQFWFRCCPLYPLRKWFTRLTNKALLNEFSSRFRVRPPALGTLPALAAIYGK
jgi:hypothetical protein